MVFQVCNTKINWEDYQNKQESNPQNKQTPPHPPPRHSFSKIFCVCPDKQMLQVIFQGTSTMMSGYFKQ